MTKLTKSQIAGRLREHGIGLTPSQVKKASHADLQHRLATELQKTAKPVRVRDAMSVDEKIRNAKIVRAPKPKGLPPKVFGQPRLAADVALARAGTKRALILDALHKGCTIDDLMRVTGWNRATCHSAIQTDVVKGNGLGVRRHADGTLHLVLPKGMKRPPIMGADQNRETARVAACK